jgi:hypothetical protein
MEKIIRKLLIEEYNQKSNYDTLIQKFKDTFPEEYRDKVDLVSDYVRNFMTESGYRIKFLKACNTGFMGVRTNRFIIICSSSAMNTLGDFVYTIFHEMRHEEQMSTLKLPNPLTGDLRDFEELFRQYWELELDADRFAKTKVAEMVLNFDIPLDIAKKHFQLSSYIQNYESVSQMIRGQIQQLVIQIKQMKQNGMEFNDIADHPIVQRHLDNLEEFI